MVDASSADFSPVFVYGALRSGTTVFRLMLNAHPGLWNPGEADFLFDHLHRQADGSWRYDLDRLGIHQERIYPDLSEPVRAATPDHDGRALLGNLLARFDARFDARGSGLLSLNIHRHITKVAELVPHARIIHLLRDPRDVARSCIGMGWAGLPDHGTRQWIATERDWDRAAGAFAADQVLELKYEDLIAGTHDQLERVCAFFGLAFDPAMLRYHEKTTYGAPDPGLIEQWRRKMAPDDLALVEGRIGPLLTARGYAPSGVAPRQPHPAERLWRRMRNRLLVWRFAIRRYGVYLVFMEKISRRLGLQGINREIQNRIFVLSRKYIK